MVKSRAALVLPALRWTQWLFQYAVVYPLAFMAMLVVLVFWCSGRGRIRPARHW